MVLGKKTRQQGRSGADDWVRDETAQIGCFWNARGRVCRQGTLAAPSQMSGDLRGQELHDKGSGGKSLEGAPRVEREGEEEKAGRDEGRQQGETSWAGTLEVPCWPGLARPLAGTPGTLAGWVGWLAGGWVPCDLQVAGCSRCVVTAQGCIGAAGDWRGGGGAVGNRSYHRLHAAMPPEPCCCGTTDQFSSQSVLTGNNAAGTIE